MFGDRFSASTSWSRWLHETEPGRLDQARSCRVSKVATHPYRTVKGALVIAPSPPAIAPSQLRLVE